MQRRSQRCDELGLLVCKPLEGSVEGAVRGDVRISRHLLRSIPVDQLFNEFCATRGGAARQTRRRARDVGGRESRVSDSLIQDECVKSRLAEPNPHRQREIRFHNDTIPSCAPSCHAMYALTHTLGWASGLSPTFDARVGRFGGCDWGRRSRRTAWGHGCGPR
jgi:hypothetical protein